ncbi:MAG: hypothetical protein MK066_05470 [Crocinitomicaceae bacterium]|nr:hypothetical protein [Crocinitomicaceae bacterium]
MKNIISILFVLFSVITFSQNDYPEIKSNKEYYKKPYKRTSSEKLTNLSENEAIFKFDFIDMSGNHYYNVMYSIDGLATEQQLKVGELLTIKTTPGKHVFQFYVGNNFEELQTDSILIEAKHCDQYIINLQVNLSTKPEMILHKPIIYLYPKESTEVTVSVDIHGKEPFYYPAYHNSWKCKAEPNGDLTIGKDTYNYLFWEAIADNSFNLSASSSGFFVEGDNVIPFLNEKLDQAGLTSKEKADFITFWGPKIANTKLSFVHFLFNEECNRYADLTITPKPDNIYRLYMIWAPSSQRFPIKKQEMKKIDRSGFTVFEWGGQVVQLAKNHRIKTSNKLVK